MKVALVLSTNLSHSPYILNYIKILEEEGAIVEILSWNKNKITEQT